jgi:hypothetical protein
MLVEMISVRMAHPAMSTLDFVNEIGKHPISTNRGDFGQRIVRFLRLCPLSFDESMPGLRRVSTHCFPAC